MLLTCLVLGVSGVLAPMGEESPVSDSCGLDGADVAAPADPARLLIIDRSESALK